MKACLAWHNQKASRARGGHNRKACLFAAADCMLQGSLIRGIVDDANLALGISADAPNSSTARARKLVGARLALREKELHNYTVNRARLHCFAASRRPNEKDTKAQASRSRTVTSVCMTHDRMLRDRELPEAVRSHPQAPAHPFAALQTLWRREYSCGSAGSASKFIKD